MINYIIQVVLFQILFLAVYDFFLSKETFFTKNRWYLLSTPILSFLLPLVKIPTFQKAVPQEYIVYLPDIILSPEKVIQETSFYQSIDYVDVLFVTGVIVFSVLFLLKLLQIINLIRSYKLNKKEGYTLVLIPKQNKAFSFFNYIFLGNDIPESQKEQVIEHELVHSRQKHSLDLLLFEFLKIVMWFNPMIFIYQKRITLVHEYISDEIATKTAPKENYINQLLSNFFQVENIAFVNQFYKHSLIKKRIIMMKKKQSKKMNQLKYLVLIPVLLCMLFYTSCSVTSKVSEKETTKKTDLQIEKLIKENTLLKKSLKSREVSSDGSVNFMVIDKAPTFPGCDTGDKNCFSKMVQKHFTRNFKSNLVNQLGLSSGRKRVFIGFKIDKEGAVVDVKARAPHPKIEAEVIRVMNSLPRVIPGENKGEKVVVNYNIPFTLLVEKSKNVIADKNSESLKGLTAIVETSKGSVNFLKIDKAPTFPGCESGDKNCFSKMIQKHIAKNFDSKLPNKLGLSSGKKRTFISFKIDKEGAVVDVNVRAPHQKIKEEVIRVLGSLPRMIPGENEGKKVDVSYAIPFVIFIGDKK